MCWHRGRNGAACCGMVFIISIIPRFDAALLTLPAPGRTSQCISNRNFSIAIVIELPTERSILQLGGNPCRFKLRLLVHF